MLRPMTMHDVTSWLAGELSALRFAPPVAHVYNPLEYAAAPYARYLDLYGEPPREVVLLGMNPGPFGMVQTGVPFGDVGAVRGWLGIEAPVRRPAAEHPKRPVLGFAIGRGEVSGQRIWSWAADTFGAPAAFFARIFVANYCPLAFLEEGGKNRTPDKLRKAEREALYRICDEALRRTVALLRPRLVVGVGRFAEQRAREALDGTGVTVGMVLHPSPASPKANQGWAAQATAQLRALGVSLP
jgi:single-strand selective monofunctional uracil DNA glycosylase